MARTVCGAIAGTLLLFIVVVMMTTNTVTGSTVARSESADGEDQCFLCVDFVRKLDADEKKQEEESSLAASNTLGNKENDSENFSKFRSLLQKEDKLNEFEQMLEKFHTNNNNNEKKKNNFEEKTEKLCSPYCPSQTILLKFISSKQQQTTSVSSQLSFILNNNNNNANNGKSSVPIDVHPIGGQGGKVIKGSLEVELSVSPKFFSEQATSSPSSSSAFRIVQIESAVAKIGEENSDIYSAFKGQTFFVKEQEKSLSREEIIKEIIENNNNIRFLLSQDGKTITTTTTTTTSSPSPSSSEFPHQCVATEPSGQHIMLDLFHVNGENLKKLENRDTARAELGDYIRKSGMTLLDFSFFSFPCGGMTAVFLLAESHVSIHTWPESRFAAVDVFTCGDGNPQSIADAFVEYLGPESMTVSTLQRGANVSANERENLSVLHHPFKLLNKNVTKSVIMQTCTSSGSSNSNNNNGACTSSQQQLQEMEEFDVPEVQIGYDVKSFPLIEMEQNYQPFEPLNYKPPKEICVNGEGPGEGCFLWRPITYLHGERSPFQMIEVVDTKPLGRCLLSDRVVQFCESDNHIYTAALGGDVFRRLQSEEFNQVASAISPPPPRGSKSKTPAPLPDKHNVLIVGGGDGWVASYILDHFDNMTAGITILDIDPDMPRLTQKYFKIAGNRNSFTDPMVNWKYGDAAVTIKDIPAKSQSIVIVDSTDFFQESSAVLFTGNFYEELHRVLKPGGLIVQQMNTDESGYRGFYVKVTRTWNSVGLRIIRRWGVSVPSFGPQPSMFWMAEKRKRPASITETGERKDKAIKRLLKKMTEERKTQVKALLANEKDFVQVHTDTENSVYDVLKKQNVVFHKFDVERMGIINGSALLKSEYSGKPIKLEPIKGFWLQVMQNSPKLTDWIFEPDIPALQYLIDIRYFALENVLGFGLEFQFAKNPYFRNSVITKTYIETSHARLMAKNVLMRRIESSGIKWYKGKNLAKIVKKRVGLKHPMEIPSSKLYSFFDFFSPPEMPTEEDERIMEPQELFELAHILERDYVIALTFRDQILPNAASYYLGVMEEEEIVFGETDDDDY